MTRGGRAGRMTQSVTSVVTVKHSRNVDVRAAAAATSTAPNSTTRKAGAMFATHAKADWMSPSATHATQTCMGARGIDGLAGGERGRDRGHG